VPHIASIEKDITSKTDYFTISKKIFLSYPTKFFIDKYDEQFEICNEISEKFNIPLTSIQFTGSAKTGFSLFKNKPFEERISDLDVSIICSDIFIKYLQLSLGISSSYTNLTKFKRGDRGSTMQEFRSNLSKGIFRPDLMPACHEKEEWESFFNKLSDKYINYFKSISAGIYISEFSFQAKQLSAIEKFANRETQNVGI
jgi:hypothetical protein